jgi:hypothetical protein
LRKDRAEKLVSIFSNSKLLRNNNATFWETAIVQEDDMVTSDEDSLSSEEGEE